MIFLDTCIWIELLGVRTPVKSHEIQQAKAASELLGNIIANNQTIVTCKEQLIELVSAIEKVMMKSVSKERKTKQALRGWKFEGISANCRSFKIQKDYAKLSYMMSIILPHYKI